MDSAALELEMPPHMQFGYVEELTGIRANPEVLAKYLFEINHNDEARKSAVDSMFWVGVGFFGVRISRDPYLQLNFFRQDFSGRPDIHPHSWKQRTMLYAPEGAYQHVRNYEVIPEGVDDPENEEVFRVRTFANTFLNYPQLSDYHLTELGTSRLVVESEYLKPALSVEETVARKPHTVDIIGAGQNMTVSVQHRTVLEPIKYSDDLKSIMWAKKVSEKDASRIMEVRAHLREQIAAGMLPGASLAQTTMVYVPDGGMPAQASPLRMYESEGPEGIVVPSDARPSQLSADISMNPYVLKYGEHILERALETATALAA